MKVFSLSALCVLCAGSSGYAQEPPPFRSSVDVTSLDASVVDQAGRPITDLGPAAFAVQIDGKPRRVLSAQWVSLVPSTSQPAHPAPDGYTTNEDAVDGRVIVIVVDQPNIRQGDTHTVMSTTSAFVDRLLPSDRIAVVGLGIPAPSTELTADRILVKKALERMGGQKRDAMRSLTDHDITSAEAIAIAGGDLPTLSEVADRECRFLSSASFASCRGEVEIEAGRLERDEALKSDTTLAAIGEVLTKLQEIDGPKTLVLVSESLAYNDIAKRVDELGTIAARARTNIEVLRLLDPNFMMSNKFGLPTMSPADQLRNDGLEMLAIAARGSVFTVFGDGSDFFDRLDAELSGYYLLGVESDAGDRDGRPHPIQIAVSERDLIVRSRRQMVNAGDLGRSPRDAVFAGLSSPMALTALPLRVATFALKGSEAEKVQILIHAEIGREYDRSQSIVVGYKIVDGGGRIVATRAVETQLQPVLDGTPSALQFVASASVAPGEYTLKVVAVAGGRTGSVEHAMHATLNDAGSLKTSELVVGGPPDARDGVTPVVGYTVGTGSVRGYLETYGQKSAALTVTYEIAVDAQSATLLSARAPVRTGEDGRGIFVVSMPLNRIPPGRYVVRSSVSADGKLLETLTRPFEVVAQAVRAASAGSAASDSRLSLSVDQREFMQPFGRDEALSPVVLKPFRDRVTASLKTEFETGLAALAAKEYPKAEVTLKRAIRPDVDSTSALAYLAVTFAAAGHDTEAAAVWQTALADGSDLPQIYDWLSGALLRTHRIVDARMILEEAAEKWPSDGRFSEPLAKLYATLGDGSEALAMLKRYLAAQPNDAEGFRLGVEWIYQAHAAGRVVRSELEDLDIARAYAEAYLQASGPERALVGQWLEFLEREQH